MTIAEIDKLKTFEESLPPAPQPVASYVTAVEAGDLVFTAGALPIKDGVVIYTGSAGSFTVSPEQAQEAAKLCCVNLLSVLKDRLSSLQRIKRIVKLTGYVNSTPSFTQHPFVVNAASDLLVELFGEKGKHARTAIGVSSLPLDATVELDLVVQIEH